MNSIVAATLFENPLALVVIILFGALSNWLMKRRGQEGTDASPNEGEAPPPPPDRMWLDELREPYGGLRQPGHRAAQSSSPGAFLAPLGAAPVETDERHENAARHVAPLNGHAKYPARAMRATHGPHARARAQVVPFWRQARSVRRAFIASVVFAPPKGLET